MASTFKSVRFSTSFWSGMEWVSTIYQYEIVLIVTLNVVLLFLIRWKGKFRIQFNCNEHSIQSGSSLEDDPPPLHCLQIEIKFFSIFSASKHLSCSAHWSPTLKAPSAPSFTKIQVVARNKTRKTDLLCGYTWYIHGYTMYIHFYGYIWWIHGYTMYIIYTMYM